MDPKTKFLSLTHADDTGLRESHRQRMLLVLVAAVIAMITSSTASAAGPTSTLLLAGLDGGSGSTVGPGGALYVTESAAGRISRVDPRTGKITTFASGLPKSIVGIGGTTDVAFIGGTAYALVTLVGKDFGTTDIVGIYRIDGPDSFTVVADIGKFASKNPPPDEIEFDVATGVQYALETYRGEFLVTDGHHNRVYRVTRAGEVSVLIQFGNIVPTGIATRGNTVYMAEAGPVPHAPADGKVVSFKVVSFKPKSPTVTEVASGAPLLVDVEFGRGRDLFALSQGEFGGGDPGAPAAPGTGSLVKVNGDGTFSTVVDELNQPTSVEFIRNTAYVVTLGGEIWKVENPSSPPHGASH